MDLNSAWSHEVDGLIQGYIHSDKRIPRAGPERTLTLKEMAEKKKLVKDSEKKGLEEKITKKKFDVKRAEGRVSCEDDSGH